MILAKEKINLFMKNQLLENGELYERFRHQSPDIFPFDDNQCGPGRKTSDSMGRTED